MADEVKSPKPEWVVVVEATRHHGQQSTAKCVEEYLKEPTDEQVAACQEEALKLLPPVEGWENHKVFKNPIRRKTQTW